MIFIYGQVTSLFNNLAVGSNRVFFSACPSQRDVVLYPPLYHFVVSYLYKYYALKRVSYRVFIHALPVRTSTSQAVFLCCLSLDRIGHISWNLPAYSCFIPRLLNFILQMDAEYFPETLIPTINIRSIIYRPILNHVINFVCSN